MAETKDKPIQLTAEQAIALLPDREYIHTFRNGGSLMLGADWERNSLIEELRKTNNIQVTGPTAQRMGHGIVIDSGGLLFIEAANWDEIPHPTPTEAEHD